MSTIEAQARMIDAKNADIEKLELSNRTLKTRVLELEAKVAELREKIALTHL